MRSLSTAASDLGVVAPDLASGLAGAYDNYTSARPCMTGLLARLDSINATVVVLPANVAVMSSPLSPNTGYLGTSTCHTM